MDGVQVLPRDDLVYQRGGDLVLFSGGDSGATSSVSTVKATIRTEPATAVQIMARLALSFIEKP